MAPWRAEGMCTSLGKEKNMELLQMARQWWMLRFWALTAERSAKFGSIATTFNSIVGEVGMKTPPSATEQVCVH
jgi:hypothetical protein